MNEKEISTLKSILDDHERRIKRIEEFIKKFEGILHTEERKLFGKKSFKEIGLDEDKIKMIFDVEDNQLTVIKVLGKNDVEKTQNIALLTLIGYKYLFGKDEVLSQEIRRNVDENGISLYNFATYLSKIIPTLIRRKGKPKSPRTTYRLTALGEAKARELIKKIVGE